MGTHALAIPATDERASRRIPFQGKFEYRCDEDECGVAEWRSVSREGVCIRIGRYLRPGRHMRVAFYGLELRARVIWCSATADGNHFVAGLRVVNSGPEASMLTLSAIVQRLVS